MGEFVTILPVVEDLADWRVRLRGDLDEIEFCLAGQGQGFGQWFDTQLRSVRSDQADLAGPDTIVDTGFV